jgi:hypothetical protein
VVAAGPVFRAGSPANALDYYDQSPHGVCQADALRAGVELLERLAGCAEVYLSCHPRGPQSTRPATLGGQVTPPVGIYGTDADRARLDAIVRAAAALDVPFILVTPWDGDGAKLSIFTILRGVGVHLWASITDPAVVAGIRARCAADEPVVYATVSGHGDPVRAGDPKDETPPSEDELSRARAYFAEHRAYDDASRIAHVRDWFSGPVVYRSTLREGLALAAVAGVGVQLATETEPVPAALDVIDESDQDGEPTPADLAAIEAEGPLLAAELDVVDAYAAIAAYGRDPVASRRLTVAERRLAQVAAGFTPADQDATTFRPIAPSVPSSLAGAA